MALRPSRRQPLPLLSRGRRPLGRLAARVGRLLRHVFASMSEFGFTAMGLLPPDGMHREEHARQQHYSEDELLWMAELEERDHR